MSMDFIRNSPIVRVNISIRDRCWHSLSVEFEEQHEVCFGKNMQRKASTELNFSYLFVSVASGAV